MKARASSSSVSLRLLLLLLLSCIFSTTNGKTNDDQEQQHMKPSWVKSVMSLTDTAFPYTSMYLEKGRVVVKRVHDYCFRPKPDIDFRISAKEEEGKEATPISVDVIAASKREKEGGGGIGEKVREAASKSLENSKSALEDSAKLAGDALYEVTDELKNSLVKQQQQDRAPHPQLEL